MQYVNAGARIRGERPTSKKALAAALAADPASVEFDPTDVFYTGPWLRGDAIPEHVSVSVCGPDPYRSRRWYGQVVATPDGPQIT